MGYYYVQGACVICPAGSYCVDNVKVVCNKGQISESGVSACKTPCREGMYLSNTTGGCVICPENYYCSLNMLNACPGGRKSPRGSRTVQLCVVTCPGAQYLVGDTCHFSIKPYVVSFDVQPARVMTADDTDTMKKEYAVFFKVDVSQVDIRRAGGRRLLQGILYTVQIIYPDQVLAGQGVTMITSNLSSLMEQLQASNLTIVSVVSAGAVVQIYVDPSERKLSAFELAPYYATNPSSGNFVMIGIVFGALVILLVAFAVVYLHTRGSTDERGGREGKYERLPVIHATITRR